MSLAAKLAPITLPDLDGKPAPLGSLWAERPAVVVFLRHYGWIFCREHVAQLRAHQQEFTAKGANLAAIGLGDANYARLFREETGITFPLLIDDQREAYRAADLRKANIFHLLRGDNATARKRAKAAGHRQYKLGKDPFQLGASFVFAPGDRDLFAHVSQTFGDNASIADLLRALP